MRVLLSAFACDPAFGSDEEVGWQWAKELSARGLDVHVITRGSHKSTIEQQHSKNGECSNVHFHYVDIPWLQNILKRVNRRNHIYYYFWQLQAMLAAKKLNLKHSYDLVHHVTWVSFRQPSFMWLLGIPMIFGPVAGGDSIPQGYVKHFSFKQRVIEHTRTLMNMLVRFDPLMRLTFKHAYKVIFTSEAHIPLVPSYAQEKSQVELAIGVSNQNVADLQPTASKKVFSSKLLFAGRCIGWKGMDIGLRAFAKVHALKPEATLTVIGDGADKARWVSLAKELDLPVEWLGWVPKDQVLASYPDYDLLFYPSLRDSGGFVVLEALEKGLPVASFKLGGPGVVVDDTCGVAVMPGVSLDETIEHYAMAVVNLLDRLESGEEFHQACNDRIKQFTWTALIDRIYGPLLQNSKGKA